MPLEATTAGVGLRRNSLALRWALAALGLVAVMIALVGLVFAGSPARLAQGVQIAGVDVGGLTHEQARAALARRAAEVARVPVAFTAGGKSFSVTAAQLGVESDWGAAVSAAAHEGDGFGPIRGYRRLRTRFFGTDVAPATRVYEGALAYKLEQIASEVNREHVEATLVHKGLDVELVRGQAGIELDEEAAANVLVRALASLSRSAPVALPVVTDPVEITAAELAPVAAQARTALSAPVTLTDGATRWKLPRWRMAQLLQLPAAGETSLEIAGPQAEAWFERLEQTVGRKPVDAKFRVAGDGVEIIPAKPGVAVDVVQTAENLLAAAISAAARTAQLAVVEAEPERTTAEAEAMGIESRLATYTTLYSGDSNRITNLQLAVTALDGTLVAPGDEFSLNDVVGPRTVERGYRVAPVIYEGEYQEDVGGGVSQVATTVFNAAWEAGLELTERNPHLFYISRYQLGRDATVNYPDLDLRFRNDTDAWVLVTGGYDGAGISVSIYGGEQRKVVSEPSPLRVTGPPPVKRIKDATLQKGTTRVEDEGSQSYAATVKRTVYDAGGDVVREETWNTSYRGETKIVRVGTKPKPKKKPAKDSARADALNEPAPTRP